MTYETIRVFYFGWLVWALPSNLLMQRSPAGSYLAINIFLWGAFLMWVSRLSTYTRRSHIPLGLKLVRRNTVIWSSCGSLVAQRNLSLILREFGSIVSLNNGIDYNCRFMLITSMWYTRAEQPSRISTWYAANGLGVAGGGLIGYAM